MHSAFKRIAYTMALIERGDCDVIPG